MHGQADVRQRVFDLGAIVEAEASDEFVAQSAAPKYLFKRPRLKIRAVLDGASLRGIIVQNSLQLSGNKIRLGLGVPCFKITEVRARSLRCAERLSQSFRIVCNHCSRSIQNILRRAIVAL